MSLRRAFPALVVLCITTACPGPKPEPVPPAEPGPLLAAVATRKLDQPVGTSMGGYLRTRPLSDPGSPWATVFPASRGVHTEPTVRVVALTNGLTRVAFMRLDLTIISPTLRSRLLAALAAAGEPAHVLMYATHTHAGPARFMPPARLAGSTPGTGSDFVALVMDSYDAELETRLTTAIVAATTEAFASLKPVSLGVGTMEAGDFNNDRRCENDPVYGHDFRDTAMTMIRLDEVDAAGTPIRPMVAMMHYAMHGTVLGSDNTLQSTEAPGALELYASDLVGVPVMYVQGAAGDVSPRGSPFGHNDLQGLERQGRAGAALAREAFVRAQPGVAPSKQRLDFLERGVLVGREAIGYAPGAFPEGGGIQCAAGGPGACGVYKSLPSEVVCLPLERRTPFHTALSMLRLGDDVVLLSLPGEPGTGLSRKITGALAPLGAKTALTVGYAQDHYGYLLEEDDWLRGGYEPTVSAWGWKFGPYLLGEVQSFVATVDQSQTPADVLPVPEATKRVPADAPGPVAVVTPPPDSERLATYVMVFEGGDPAFGLPQVSLEVQDGGVFGPVQASPTRAVINGPELMIRYDAEPTTKADPGATTRRHLWTVKFETLPTTPLGAYRFVARGSTKVAGVTSPYELISRVFQVVKSRAINVRARLTSDGRLALDPRFPPNETEYASDVHDVVHNYRVRDAFVNPRDGARALGAVGAMVTGLLRSPDATSAMTTLSWNSAEAAWVSEPLTTTGAYSIDFAPGAVVDANGNENGAVLSISFTR